MTAPMPSSLTLWLHNIQRAWRCASVGRLADRKQLRYECIRGDTTTWQCLCVCCYCWIFWYGQIWQNVNALKSMQKLKKKIQKYKLKCLHIKPLLQKQQKPLPTKLTTIYNVVRRKCTYCLLVCCLAAWLPTFTYNRQFYITTLTHTHSDTCCHVCSLADHPQRQLFAHRRNNPRTNCNCYPLHSMPHIFFSVTNFSWLLFFHFFALIFFPSF